MENVMNSTVKRKVLRSKGFSLLELGVVMAIVSIIGSGSMMLYSEQRIHAQWMESQAKLTVVKAALLKFTEVNKYMPCPDNSATANGQESRTITSGTIPAMPAVTEVAGTPETATAPSIPGVEAFAGQAAIPGVSVSICSANRGTVPYELLGLSKSSVEDSLGNLFEYAVDQGVTVANSMLDCPTQTACFFNSNSEPTMPVGTPAGSIMPGSFLPAFNLSTQPLKGVLGPNNLRICDEPACTNVQSEGLVAVLVAYNQNGSSPASVNETANQDGDADFVNAVYDKSPFYDDEVLGIAANEIKISNEEEAVEVFVAAPPPSAPPAKQSGNDLQNMGDNTVGSSGTNVWTDDAIVNKVNQAFSFGADAANKSIVLSFDTHARGTWDQPTEDNTSITSDTGMVSVNGSEVETYKYEYRDDTQTGYETVSYNQIKDGKETGKVITKKVDYWETSEETIVQTDENGDVDIEFLVATTANYETIDFTNIELVYYDTPPDIPSFPTVSPIPGITQTEGLNDD